MTLKAVWVCLCLTIYLGPALSDEIRKIKLFGDAILGYYYLEAHVGTPVQKQALIVDTGSNLTIFPCKPCEKCNTHTNPLFDPSKSKTFIKLLENTPYLDWKCRFFDHNLKECKFHQGYTEGSSYHGQTLYSKYG